jgi:hypothetical protein
MKEIFRIKFGHHEIETNSAEGHRKILAYRMYTIGEVGDVDGDFLTPKKISIIKDKVRVEFKEFGVVHEFTYTDDVELYKRDKQVKTDAEQTTDRTE